MAKAKNKTSVVNSDEQTKNMLRDLLKEMYEQGIKTLSGVRYPKINNKFKVYIINDTLSEDEKLLFTEQVDRVWVQEDVSNRSNILTIELTDDLANGIVSILKKIEHGDIRLCYMDGGVSILSEDLFVNCELLFNRNNVNYYDSSEVHNFKLIYKFDRVDRKPASVLI